MARGNGLLQASVGDGRPNHKADVESIQRLLNLVHAQGLIALENPLVPDGLYGRNTRNGIEACQRDLMRITSPDRVIDPDQPTILALCAALPQGYSETLLGMVMAAATQARVALFAGPIAAVMARYDISTPLRQVHFLSQVGHESGELRYMQELASGTAYEGREDLGNTQPGDGARFKGRGLIQLTGRYNYTAYGESIGRRDEVLASPAIVATDPDLCVDVAGYFWQRENLNTLADRDDVERVTRRINGGTNGIGHRRDLLERAKSLYGI